MSTDTYAAFLRTVPTADLLAELEAERWEALSVSDHGPSLEYMQMLIDDIAREIERRQKLLARYPHHPLAPPWPARDQRIKQRVQAVKERLPLDEFLRTVMHADLQPRAGGRFSCRCPLPGHDDSTPSFVVYPDGHGHCFGCGRGGDIIRIVGYIYGRERFYDKLEILESLAGIAV